MSVLSLRKRKLRIGKRKAYLYWLKICIHTKVLKINVLNWSCSCTLSYPNIFFPPKFNTKVTTIWKIACPMIIFHILSVISGADFFSGFRLRMLRVGGSVASARAANVSIMRFTQRSCTALRTDSSSLLATAETKVRTTAVIFTVIWNWNS